MNDVEAALYKTRKNINSVLEEIGCEQSISLLQCSSCNIWLKPHQLIKDLDGLEICTDCKNYYGI